MPFTNTGSSGGGGGSGTDTRQTITQLAHGFTAGLPVRHGVTLWQASNASNDTDAEVYGVVESVPTVDTFILVTNGLITFAVASLTPGDTYFLGVAGGTTTTPPTAAGTINKPVLLAISLTTALVVAQTRGAENTGSPPQIAQTYWVAKNGSDITGTGSTALPYATVQAAHDKSLIDYPLAGSSTVYVQLNVAPGVYAGNTTITRQRTVLNGAAGIAQTCGVTLQGQTTVDTSTALSKFIDPYSFQGFRFQQTGTVAAPAFRVIGSGPASVFADSCYFESASVGAGAHALYVSSTAPGNVRVELQNCLTLQSSAAGIAGVMVTAGADVRLNDCQIQATGSASGHALHVQSNSTVLAGRTLFDSNAALATILLDSTIGVITIPPTLAIPAVHLNTCQVVNTNSGTSATGITIAPTTTNLALLTSFMTWAVGTATTTTTSRNVSVPTVESGTTTLLSTTTTVIDASKTWTVNQYANRVVQLTSGALLGQARTIVSNTSTVLTVTPAFTGVPALGVTYKIVPFLTWYRASDVFQLTTAYSSAVGVVALATTPVGAI